MVSNIIYCYNKKKSYVNNIRCNVYSEYMCDIIDTKVKLIVSAYPSAHINSNLYMVKSSQN